jgi:hypothetical protein
MSSIVAHAHGALSVSADPAERAAVSRDRVDRLAALDPEQFPLALSFLIGYLPSAFDAAVEAVEPPSTGEKAPEMEPFCVRCNAPVGVFLAHGPEYQHFRGVLTATSKPRPYKAGHAPVVGWRPATDIPAPARG